ncbi:MAG: carboxypeptidase regulatory-like domain-containing protein, partial [Candidatus Neomarinimicrobiota bacterium]
MKKLALILTLILIPAFALAQTSGKLSGTVTGDGQPLAGANVLVKGTTYGSATDENGRYFVLDVPVGAYEIEAQYIGYKTLTISNVHVNANLTTELDFPLEVAAVEGETVQVVAERPLIQRNATNTTAIMDQELVQALPVRTIGDIVALQAGAVGTNVRGGRESDNAYYIDGVLMKDRWSGGNFQNSLSQQSLSEVSFQAGGMSAEYGGANGGVVTIDTLDGVKKFSAAAQYVTDFGDTSPG